MSFAYTETDRLRITGAVGGHSDFLNVKDCKQQFRELERLKRKTIAYDLHLKENYTPQTITLAEYIKVQCIPRGLRVRLCPTLFSQDKDFCLKWESIVNKCSNDLMLATMEQLQRELPEMERITEAEMDSIRNAFPADDVAEGTSKLTDHLEKFRNEVEARKRTKFQRGASDYATGRVYRWAYDSYAPPVNRRPSRMPYARGDERRDRSRSTSASTTSSFLGGSQATGSTSEDDGGVVESTAGQTT
ncbi:hypothetical protein XELAEV_18003856mg [Xenopus laevis]|nr:hypothetical protein XELAEV_18003856mg [Xenopus laevis]